jgi:hypothetical protein
MLPLGTKNVARIYCSISCKISSRNPNATTFSLTLYNMDWTIEVPIASGIPIADGPCQIPWSVPISLPQGGKYYIRAHVENSYTEKQVASAATGLFNLLWENELENQFLSLVAPNRWFVGAPITISWNYTINSLAIPSKWNIDLYSAGNKTKLFSGINIGSVPSAGCNTAQFVYTVPDSLLNGAYYIRVWGYSSTNFNLTTINNITPISQISRVFVITNPANPVDASKLFIRLC